MAKKTPPTSNPEGGFAVLADYYMQSCKHGIAVIPTNGAPHGPGIACSLTGGHWKRIVGCGYEDKNADPYPHLTKLIRMYGTTTISAVLLELGVAAVKAEPHRWNTEVIKEMSTLLQDALIEASQNVKTEY